MAPEGRLSAAFLQLLPERARSGWQAVAGLEQTLSQLCAAAQAEWPSVRVEGASFAGYLAARLPAAARPEDALTRMRAGELFLACACAAGSSEAIALLEERYFPTVESALRRLRGPATLVDDVKQHMRDALFVRTPERRPRIAEFAGQGELKSWLQAVAVRTGLNLLRRGKNEVVTESEELLDVPIPEDDPELRHLRERYREEFRSALDEALKALPAPSQNLLRLYYVNGLTLEALGALHRVHAATISRRLATARAAILDETRRTLGQRFKLEGAQLDSLIRLIRSHLSGIDLPVDDPG